MYQDEAARLDKLCRNLGGTSGWIRSNLDIITKPSQFKAHDWMLVMQWASEYIFHDLLENAPKGPQRREMMHGLLRAIRSCLGGFSAVDSPNRDYLKGLKEEVVQALVACEKLLPATELSVMFHVLLHVPDVMSRWNNPRNYWSFFGERSVFN